MKFPDELYVQVEGKGDDEFLNMQADPKLFAVVGETVLATLYRRVGTVRIKSPLEVIKPKVSS